MFAKPSVSGHGKHACEIQGQQAGAAPHLPNAASVCARCARVFRTPSTNPTSQRFPFLQADAEEYNTMSAEGVLSCVRLHGVVSMPYKTSAYNIPMTIYVPNGYPQRAPIMFVLETSAVAIKPQHPHVGPNGMVYLPYSPMPNITTTFPY